MDGREGTHSNYLGIQGSPRNKQSAKGSEEYGSSKSRIRDRFRKLTKSKSKKPSASQGTIHSNKIEIPIESERSEPLAQSGSGPPLTPLAPLPAAPPSAGGSIVNPPAPQAPPITPVNVSRRATGLPPADGSEGELFTGREPPQPSAKAKRTIKGKVPSSDSGSSSRRRAQMQKLLLAALRRKDSQRRPVAELNTMFEANSKYAEPTDVKALQRRRRRRQKSMDCAVLWMNRATIATFVIAFFVFLGGALSLYMVNLEMAAHKSAINETKQPWTAECLPTTTEMQRKVNGLSYVLTCRPSIVLLSNATWSNWSDCIKGTRRKWRQLSPTTTYLKDEDGFAEDNNCST